MSNEQQRSGDAPSEYENLLRPDHPTSGALGSSETPRHDKVSDTALSDFADLFRDPPPAPQPATGAAGAPQAPPTWHPTGATQVLPARPPVPHAGAVTAPPLRPTPPSTPAAPPQRRGGWARAKRILLWVLAGLMVYVTALVAYTQTSPSLSLRWRTLMRRSVVDGQGQFDGVVVGTSFPSQTNALGLDPQFGAGGFKQFFYSAAPGFRHSTGNQLAVQLMGGNPRLLIAGYTANAQDLDPSMAVFAMDLLSGNTDASFNGGNARVFDYAASGIHGDAYADDLLVTPDGKILVGGGYEYAGFAFGDAALARLNADGSFDDSFGNLNIGLPGRMGYGYTLLGSDRDNRLASMALSADGERVVFSGFAYASDDGSYYASVMRARLHAVDLLRNGFE